MDGSPPPDSVHASCVVLPPIGGTKPYDWRGILLRGPSGAGKSSAALSLIRQLGARLVADDRVILRPATAGLLAYAPPAIAGRVEVRGVGVQELPYRSPASVGLVVDITSRDLIDTLDRLPPRRVLILQGVCVDTVTLPWPDIGFSDRVEATLNAACDRRPL